MRQTLEGIAGVLLLASSFYVWFFAAYLLEAQ